MLHKLQNTEHARTQSEASLWKPIVQPRTRRQRVDTCIGELGNSDADSTLKEAAPRFEIEIAFHRISPPKLSTYLHCRMCFLVLGYPQCRRPFTNTRLQPAGPPDDCLTVFTVMAPTFALQKSSPLSIADEGNPNSNYANPESLICEAPPRWSLGLPRPSWASASLKAHTRE